LQVAILGEFRVTGFIEIALQGLVSESIWTLELQNEF
jgi:hypothetical protein